MKPTIVKYLYQCLPVGRRVHFKYNPKYDPGCPSCGCMEETEAHVYQCRSMERRLWKGRTLTKLGKILSACNTDPTLSYIAFHGLHHLLMGGTFDPTKYEGVYYELAADQHHIGWDNFFRGRLSKRWAILQQAHLRRLGKDTKKKNGTLWATNLASFMLTQWAEVWKLRNTARHGKDQAEQWKMKEYQLMREVSEMYRNANLAVPEGLASKIFTVPLEERMQQPRHERDTNVAG